MNNFIGEIRLFGFTFAPDGWALCSGQIIAISTNTALFSLLGTQYGGNGTTTFGLPDLRGRAAIGFGQGPGLSNYVQGEVSGTENISISINNMPAHTHIAKVSNQEGSVADPVTGNSLAAMVDTSVNKILSYSTAAPTVALNTNTNSVAGGSIPISIMQPTLALNYCIALNGVFPSRN